MNDFDQRARTWDDDPGKVQNGQRVAEAIRSCVALHRDMDVLDFGCGTGLLSIPLQSYVGPMLLVDSSPGMLAVLEQKITDLGTSSRMTTCRLDLMQDPLPDQRFDIIVTMMTLHHIPDIGKILSIFHTLLRPQGRLCIADLDSEDGSFHGEGFTGANGFDRNDLTQRLSMVGFTNVIFRTCSSIEKTVQGEVRSYPVFLATCTKA